VQKTKVVLIVIFAVLLFVLSVFLYLQSRSSAVDPSELDGRVYRNERFSYAMNYPYEWEIEEREGGDYFHQTAFSRELPAMGFDWGTYRSEFGSELQGASPLTYIDGTVDYNIEKRIYPNINEFTLQQWYNLAVLAEALSSQKMSESRFVRLTRELIENRSLSDKEGVFDPWMSRGSVIKIGNRDVLKATRVGDHQYDGYQYYIFRYDEHIFVFHFGFGGPVIPREMWERSDRFVKEMILSLRDL